MEAKEAEDRAAVQWHLLRAITRALRRRGIADDDFMEEVHMAVADRVEWSAEQTAILSEWIDHVYKVPSGG